MPERARADTASILAVRTRRNGSAYGLFTAAHQALNQTRAVLPATPAVSNTMDHVSTRSLRLGPLSISRSSHGRRDRLAWALNGRHRPFRAARSCAPRTEGAGRGWRRPFRMD